MEIKIRKKGNEYTKTFSSICRIAGMILKQKSTSNQTFTRVTRKPRIQSDYDGFFRFLKTI